MQVKTHNDTRQSQKHHQVTGRGSLTEVLDAVLENNRALLSTIEKPALAEAGFAHWHSVRLDEPPYNSHQLSRWGRGGSGASYFFTRIRKLPDTGIDMGNQVSISSRICYAVWMPSSPPAREQAL